MTVALKALFIIIDNRTENIEPKQLGEIEACLVSLGDHCDGRMLSGGEQSTNAEIQEWEEALILMNLLLYSMSE